MMRLIVNAILLGFLLGAAAAAQANGGAIRLERDELGHVWFADADGSRFLSLGINNISPEPYKPRPDSDFYDPIPSLFGGDAGAWRASVEAIMARAGLNTIGCWSAPQLNVSSMFQTPILYVAGYEESRCLAGLRPDFEATVRSRVAEVLAEWPDRSHVVGFFLDNELAWYGTTPWTDLKNDTLLEAAFRLPVEDTARAAALGFLRERHGDSLEAFRAAWGLPKVTAWEALGYEDLRRSFTEAAMADRSAFLSMAAEAFYATAGRVAREMAPGALLLGSRFAGHAPEEVVRACGRHNDVVSFNDYRFGDSADPDAERIARMYLWGGGKPLMVTEYSWRATENQSGNPNTGGAGTVVATQRDRAERNTRYLEQLFEYPMVVGAHWFEWADQSPQGRFDGENSNYGVVDIHHGTYDTLIDAMAEINARAAEIHAASTMAAPTEVPKAKAVVFEPGQYPHRPPTLSLLGIEATQPPATWSAGDASINLSPLADAASASGAMLVEMKTGRDWGCGLSLFGPRSLALTSDDAAEAATDLDGYSRIVVEAEASDDLQFRVYLDEAAVAAPGQSAPPRFSDDGESFTSGVLMGEGRRAAYTIEIGAMTGRGDWGNQNGARRIDLQAARGLALYFPGLQGEQQLHLYNVRLER